MTSVLPWRLLRSAPSANPETLRWQRLLDAALATPHYSARRGVLERVRAAAPTTAVSRLPVVELGDFFRDFRRFQNPNITRPEPRSLGAVWEPAPRTTALKPWFHLENQARVLVQFSAQELNRIQPECIAAPVETLRSIARQVRLESLTHGIIAFTGIGRHLLTETDRELFWRTFGVPVYEQFRGFHGELLATECERHDGLHIQTETAVFEQRGNELLLTSLTNLRYPVLRLATGLAASLETSECDCGLASPRLLHLGVLSERGKRARVATAAY